MADFTPEDYRVDGKVAIVTGAGRLGNIGVAVARAFLREGAKARPRRRWPR